MLRVVPLVDVIDERLPRRLSSFIPVYSFARQSSPAAAARALARSRLALRELASGAVVPPRSSRSRSLRAASASLRSSSFAYLFRCLSLSRARASNSLSEYARDPRRPSASRRSVASSSDEEEDEDEGPSFVRRPAPFFAPARVFARPSAGSRRGVGGGIGSPGGGVPEFGACASISSAAV